MTICKVIQSNDEYQCSCGLTWDIHEGDPHSNCKKACWNFPDVNERKYVYSRRREDIGGASYFIVAGHKPFKVVLAAT